MLSRSGNQKGLRTKHSLERFANVLDRDRLQAVLLLHIVAHMRRNDTALESQPRNLRQALIQMAHGAYLSRQADLTDGSQIAADRQILVARCDRQNDRQVCCRLVQPQAADNVDVRITARQ